MKTEELTALGLTEDQASKVFELHGKEITKLQNSVNTLTTERDGLKTQLGEANTKLTGYDPDWKAKADTAAQEAEKKIGAMKFDYALNDALKAAKARDVVAVKAHLNMDGLKQTGDEIVGLNDQLTKIKETSGFLFEDADGKPAPKFSSATPGPEQNNKTDNEKINAALRGAFGGKE